MSKGKVLVVDDSLATVTILKRILINNNYEVETASNGQEGCEKALIFNPHLILSDWMMPTMTGPEFCVKIKHNPETQYIYFIILTSIQDKIEETLGNTVQADDYIAKPYNQKELLARINSGIRIHKLQKTLLHSMKELQKKQQELSTAEKMAALGILSAGISHEVNNPLNVISGMVQFLQKDFNTLKEFCNSLEPLLSSEESQIKFKELKEKLDVDYLIEDFPVKFEKSYKNIKRIENILNDLALLTTKDYSDFANVYIEDIITETLKLIDPVENNFPIIFEIPKNKNYINCNFNQIKHAIFNLIISAVTSIKVSKNPQKYLKIETLSSFDAVIVNIYDTGETITMDNQDKIFLPFYSPNQFDTKRGLGLSTCYYILKNHNTSIKILQNKESETGNKYILTFPRIS